MTQHNYRTPFEFLRAIDENFLAGLLSADSTQASIMTRHANALACALHFNRLPDYRGTRLYPVGEHSDIYNPDGDAVVFYFYPHTVRVTHKDSLPTIIEKLSAKAERYGVPLEEPLLTKLGSLTADPILHIHQYRGWTHSIVNFKRILTEGLPEYRRRINEKLPSDKAFYRPLLVVLDAICDYSRRCADYLQKTQLAPDELVEAFRHIPEGTPRNLYEAFVFYNFFWFVDGHDDGGRMDDVLEPFYHGESEEEIASLFRECWLGYYYNEGWHVTFDSHKPQWLTAALKGERGLNRPGSSVLLDDETPQTTWDAIFDSWDSGNTNPSLYFRPNYEKGLGTYWNVRKEDFGGLAYGGCTELMIMGKSNVGSTDGRLRVLQALANMPLDAPDFESFHARLLEFIYERAKQTVDLCEFGHSAAALFQPNLIRTIFTDDCIDNGKEFNACGPRYNSGLIGVTGLTNFVNAVYNIKLAYEGVFDIKELSQALKDNFEGHEALLAQLRATPKFGNDNDDIDALATTLINEVFEAVRAQSRPHRQYIPFINLFTTYANEGAMVGATADGRLAWSPVGDSFGPVQGTDTNGPTAMLNSVTKPNQLLALGTPVLNIRLSKNMISTAEMRAVTRDMLMAYFHRGGLQIQVTILDGEAMKDALEHPDLHKDLMVRIGGYSEYFTQLTRPVQLEVIKRSEHTLAGG